MITAVEALGLPTAALSPSDREAADALLAQIEAFIRTNMQRTGCVMVLTEDQAINGAIAWEVERAFRSRGWVAAWEQIIETSRFTGEKVSAGVRLALRPTNEAYAEFERSSPAGGRFLSPEEIAACAACDDEDRS